MCTTSYFNTKASYKRGHEFLHVKDAPKTSNNSECVLRSSSHRGVAGLVRLPTMAFGSHRRTKRVCGGASVTTAFGHI